MTSIPALALIATVVALTWLVVATRRERVESWYERGDTWRKLLTAAAIALVAWTFVRSGDPVLIAFALGGIALATVYVIIEQPHKTVV